MKLLEERILKDGRILDGNVLKVDSFLNHCIDVPFICELGKEFKRIYENENITKIMTIEASGIGIACLVAQYFNVPVVFAKKSMSTNIAGDVYSAPVTSYTHGRTYEVIVSKRFIDESDRVLIIDDFLAVGSALKGLINVCEQAGATVVGCGICIEKQYQGGGDALREKGFRIESLAKISRMENGEIEFCD
jgi:xanthine phosphoribosyltransferase